MALATIQHAQGGVLVRKGRAVTSPMSEFDRREALVIGSYKPDGTNTGLLGDPSRPLTVHDGDLTVTTAGQVVKDLHVMGRIIIQAANVTVDNCWVRGPAANITGQDTGLIVVGNPTLNALIRDCYLDPQTPGPRQDGIRNCGYTAKRVKMRWTTDGFGVFNTTSGGDMNVSILGCWVQNMAKFYPDEGVHADGTHNDGVQAQGGNHLLIQGNRIEAVVAQQAGNTSGQNVQSGGTAYSPANYETNSCIQLNANTGPLTDVQILDNFLYGGIIGINGLATAFQTASNLTGLVIRRNRFDHNQYNGTQATTLGRINVQPQASIDCPTSGSDANIYEDTGQPVELKRG